MSGSKQGKVSSKMLSQQYRNSLRKNKMVSWLLMYQDNGNPCKYGLDIDNCGLHSILATTTWVIHTDRPLHFLVALRSKTIWRDPNWSTNCDTVHNFSNYKWTYMFSKQFRPSRVKFWDIAHHAVYMVTIYQFGSMTTILIPVVCVSLSRSLRKEWLRLT